MRLKFKDARARLDRLPLQIYQYRIQCRDLKTRIGNRTEVLNTEILLQDRKYDQAPNTDLLIKNRKKESGLQTRINIYRIDYNIRAKDTNL